MTNFLAMRLNKLQMFSADGAGSGAGTGGLGAEAEGDKDGDTNNNSTAGAETEPKDTFQGPKNQSEYDAAINKAVQTALDNYKKGEADRIQQAIQKEKDYSNLSAKEREAQEFADQQKAFEQERAAFEQEKLTVQVEKDLVAKGLPAEMAGFLAIGDAETALANVGKFETAFNAAVAEKVKASLRQPAPGQGGSGGNTVNYGEQLAKGNVLTGSKLF